ncbi:hypothetical protein BGZ61DRAFT_481881 [Ilyonectria robusta]|uniref:uncharacterized protein n=1 Tax=Ilyonectria robusta TaxID=1079257 RepID=UPI001E8DFDF3|nr:uncharacterized protein BGZ61DRAFT_481881 [Ilyonectria robusta]KAH8674900.1 hypothetical protein BGZ61DRAFT_481881 [Ilyonectria robusta]
MNKKRAGRGARGRLLILLSQEKGLAMAVSQGWLGDGPLSPLAGRGPCCDGTARAQEAILKRRVETRARGQAFSTSRSVPPYVDADDVDVEVAICKWIAVVVEASASDCLPDSACHSPTENPHCTLACTLSAGGGQCGLPLRVSPTRYMTAMQAAGVRSGVFSA